MTASPTGGPPPGCAGPHLPLRAGEWTATVCAVGGALVALADDVGPVVAPPPAGGCPRAEFRGVVLAPWPNRTATVWRFDGRTFRLPVTDPGTGTAIHGLVADRTWRVAAQGDAHAELAIVFGGDQGYPFEVALSVRYDLDGVGLAGRLAAVHRGEGRAPVGLGVHPYLTTGATVDDTAVALSAASVLRPAGEGPLDLVPVPVAGTDEDLREGRALGDRQLDHGYGDLAAEGAADLDAGWARATLSTGGRRVVVAAGPEARWWMVYTSDTLPGPSRRTAIAVEPMTCPPDALTTGRDLALLGPGEELALRWTIRASGVR